MISDWILRAYRAPRFGLTPETHVATLAQALDFINQRGVVFFYPAKEIPMPSLWVAVAGDRPVPDNHDDPGNITWTWKDESLGLRRWYYGRALRKRNMFISLALLPHFYALSPNYGDYTSDYQIDYEQGQLTQAARLVYEVLLREGVLDTIALRKAARLQSSEADFTRALNELQASFRVLPMGVTQAGAWHYSFSWDIVARHLPALPEQARAISEYQARQTLITTYLDAVGAAREKDLVRLFGWPAPVVAAEVRKLCERGALVGGVALEGFADSWLASPHFAQIEP